MQYQRLVFVPSTADVTTQSLAHHSETGWRVAGYSVVQTPEGGTMEYVLMEKDDEL